MKNPYTMKKFSILIKYHQIKHENLTFTGIDLDDAMRRAKLIKGCGSNTMLARVGIPGTVEIDEEVSTRKAYQWKRKPYVRSPYLTRWYTAIGHFRIDDVCTEQELAAHHRKAIERSRRCSQ